MPKKTPTSRHDPTLKVQFGAAVRRYRHRLGLSQEELAWRADMHRTYLADVERGMRNLSLSSIARIVNAIGVSLTEFFIMMESLDVPAYASAHRKKSRSGARGGR